jgi:replicative DNA helicase
MFIDERSENIVLSSIFYAMDDDTCKGIAIDAVAGLSEADFTTQWRKEAFLAVKSVLGVNGTPDAVNVCSIVSGDALGGICGLANHSTTCDITISVRKLQESTKARAFEMFAYTIPDRLSTCTDINIETESIEREFLAIASDGKRKISDEGFLSEFCGAWFDEKQKQMSTGETGFIMSGIPSIDKAIGGFRGGDIIVIAGRTAMGKSSLAMTFMAHQVKKQNAKIALFSVELGRVEIFDKYVSMFSAIDYKGDVVPFKNIHNPAGAFGGAGLSGSQLNRVSEVVGGEMVNSSIYVRGIGRVTVEEIMSKTRKLVYEGKCDALYIDHIGLLVRDKAKEREELTHITNSLRIFAGEMNIPVFEVVQMNRGADNAKQRPQLSNLKGSGSIEEDASIIIMPWRPFAIDKDAYPPEQSELIIAKGRNGGEGIIPSHFDTRTTMFSELDNSHDVKEIPRF